MAKKLAQLIMAGIIGLGLGVNLGFFLAPKQDEKPLTATAATKNDTLVAENSSLRQELEQCN